VVSLDYGIVLLVGVIDIRVSLSRIVCQRVVERGAAADHWPIGRECHEL
jgi:hypothetical protein